MKFRSLEESRPRPRRKAKPSQTSSPTVVISESINETKLFTIKDPAATTTRDFSAAVRSSVRSILGSDIAPDSPLMSSGLDSLGAVELRNSLEAALGVSLPGTLVFDYPSIEAITMHLLQTSGVGMALEATTRSKERRTIDPSSLCLQLHPGSISSSLPLACLKSQRPIFVDSLVDRNPLTSKSLDPAASCHHLSSWRDNGALERDPVGLTPFLRWDVELKESARWGSFLPLAHYFDPEVFGISANEALLMDPQQRLLLELTLEATSPFVHNDSRSVLAESVFIGCASSDYSSLVRKHGGKPGAYQATSNALSVIPGRLAHVFGFSGAAVAVDTACSSSLVATHLAVQELCLNVADGHSSALVGGVHIQATDTSSSYVLSANMLSPEGRCKVRGTST